MYVISRASISTANRCRLLSYRTLFTKLVKANGNDIAIADVNGSFRYSSLLKHTSVFSQRINDSLRRCIDRYDDQQQQHQQQQRVAVLCPRDYTYVVSQLAVWYNMNTFVPLCTSHPPAEWEYVLHDASINLLVVHRSFLSSIQSIANASLIPILCIDSITESVDNENVIINDDAMLPISWTSARMASREAMVIYSSGTTGRPKGVLHTYGSLAAQIDVLVHAWRWSHDDRILHVLPLHHTHGIVNALLCALWANATVEMQVEFCPADVIKALSRDNCDAISVFMAVPTIYSKLLRYLDRNSDTIRKAFSERCAQVRLMVSGSSALHIEVFNRWRCLTSHTLLERYGMTETGMILSNPYDNRIAGRVGRPLPGVEVRILSEDTNEELIREHGDDLSNADNTVVEYGALEVRSKSLFKEYLNLPQATAKEFTTDGWFKTGDIVSRDSNGFYMIKGRASQDIFKVGGYKVSAIEIENAMLEHPSVKEACALGINDDVYGERIAAVVVGDVDVEVLRSWVTERLASYKVPREWRVVANLERNAMGKLVKKDVRCRVFNE